jgi:hypothetical protein
MKPPYLKKICETNGFLVFYVDGHFIRDNYNKEFTNFGSRRFFKFIPKNEIWIDHENKNQEAGYLIGHFLVLQKQLKNGKTYEKAVKIADEYEKRERNKSKLVRSIKKLKRDKIIKEIYKKQLFLKYTKNIRIWLVKGFLVRSIFFLDFTEGGHDKVYDFIPKNEIWIDDSLYKKEIVYILVHELHERYLMKKGWIYESKGIGVFSQKAKKGEKSAHFEAEKVETYCRKHPKEAKEILIREIKKNDLA